MQHQINNTTVKQRYPEIFNEVKRLRPDAKRILSFGCSTGEEICTLKEYYPDSFIEGVEINDKCIDICKLKGLSVNHYDQFLNSDTKYDIIFAMSVLCRYDDTKPNEYITKIYIFDRFDKEIENLVNRLRKDGLLIVYNSNYLVQESTSFCLMQICEEEFKNETGFVPKMFNDNKPCNIDFFKPIFKKL